MNEDGPLLCAIRKIRRAWQVTVVNTVAMTECVEILADPHLGSSAMLPNLAQPRGSSSIENQRRVRTA